MSSTAVDELAARPEDEVLPLGTSVVYGLQHILSMFGGVIAVPLIIGSAAGLDASSQGMLVSCALFVSGLATILQTVGVGAKSQFGFGSQLPLVQGISFAAVSTLLAIIGKNGVLGLRSAMGATIVAGVFAFLIVPFFAQVIRYFPPVVTGSIITVIGLSLMPAAGKWIVGNPTVVQNGHVVVNPNFGNPNAIALAMVTLVFTLAMSSMARLARMSILLGLVFGTIVAAIWTAINPAAALFKAPSIGGKLPLALPHPFAIGTPIFEIGAIVSMAIVMIVVMVETTADLIAVGEVVGTEVDSRRVANGLRADMASCIVAPVFNTFPATAFAQNVGLVALTGIKSRWVVAAGGAILAFLGLSPWLAALIGALPTPVLGGVGIALFGTVAASGIRSLGKVNYDGNNNMLIVAVSVGFGLLPSLFPHIAGPGGTYLPGFWHHLPSWASVILDSGISTTAAVAFLLNLVFNVWGHGDDSRVHVTEAHRPARAVTSQHLDELKGAQR